MTRLKPDASIPGLQLVYGVDMPFNKANPQLGEALNADVKAMRSEGKVGPALEAWKQNDPLTVNGQS